jgi:hypothetical protein
MCVYIYLKKQAIHIMFITENNKFFMCPDILNKIGKREF